MAVRESWELARFPVVKLMLQQKRMGGVCRNMGRGRLRKGLANYKSESDQLQDAANYLPMGWASNFSSTSCWGLTSSLWGTLGMLSLWLTGLTISWSFSFCICAYLLRPGIFLKHQQKPSLWGTLADDGASAITNQETNNCKKENPAKQNPNTSVKGSNGEKETAQWASYLLNL